MTLADVRLALRITTDAFDKELSDLMSAAEMDLGIAKYHFELGAGTENFTWA